MIRAVSDGFEIRVKVSTNTVGMPRSRPTRANGTTGPAPVLRITSGRSALKIRHASNRFTTKSRSRSECRMK